MVERLGHRHSTAPAPIMLRWHARTESRDFILPNVSSTSGDLPAFGRSSGVPRKLANVAVFTNYPSTPPSNRHDFRSAESYISSPPMGGGDSAPLASLSPGTHCNETPPPMPQAWVPQGVSPHSFPDRPGHVRHFPPQHSGGAAE